MPPFHQLLGSVSIHASVKDATVLFLPFYEQVLVSIHASVKDATLPGLLPVQSTPCFNPRICKRCDVKGNELKLTVDGFNPRICKRCDKFLVL